MHFKSFMAVSLSLLAMVTEAKKKKNKQKEESLISPDVLEYIYIATGATILFGLLIYLLKKRQNLMRASKVQSIRKALQTKQKARKDKSCTMTQMQKDEVISWFSKQNWSLQQSQRKDKSSTTPLQIVSIKRKVQSVDGQKLLKDYYDAFQVQMKGKGAACDILGVIMFEKFFMTFIFQKSCSNAKNSNGIYEFKFFEGALKKGTFEGKWYVSDETKMEAERQALQEHMRSTEQGATQRSFSRFEKQNEQGSPLMRLKTSRGTFKMFPK